MRYAAWTAVFAVFLAALAAPCLAAMYVWKDEKGVVHMTDRKPESPAGNVEVIGPETSQKPANQKNRAEKIADMQKAAAAHPRFAELAAIAKEYNKTHTYSTVDYFVCIDMALEMANILKTRGFVTHVVAGNGKVDLAGLPKDKIRDSLDHAWVVVELTPGLFAPVETTAGMVVTASKQHSEYYYQGLVFENSKQAKETDVLIRSTMEFCKSAQAAVDDFNANYANRPMATGLLAEAKGRVDTKIKDCTDNKSKYDALIARIYRNLY